MRRLNRRGISPVIATIIIVAVAIAIAIAVAFWVVGIAGLFTRYEKLEISYIYADKTTNGDWTVTLCVKNTGSATATIDQVFFNGKPSENVAGTENLITSLSPGASVTVTLTIPSTEPVIMPASGMTLEVKLHTAAGQEYYKAVVLP